MEGARKVHKRRRGSFRHDETTVEVRRAYPLLKNADEKRWETSSIGRSLRGRSPFGQRHRRLCKRYVSAKCTNSPCDSWHTSVCVLELQNQIRAANSMKGVLLCTEADGQPQKKE